MKIPYGRTNRDVDTAGKTKVPTTQSRLAVAGGEKDVKVSVAFANVRANVV